jgi:uncharacterized membrane protein AbrB (regulator of aidB expression)
MRQLITIAAAILIGVGSLQVQTQGQTTTSTATLGTARIPAAVMADGKTLAAGTYQVRLTTVTPPKVVGQTVEETRWIEFMRGGTMVGREVATVVTPAVIEEIKDRPAPAGAVAVQTLKGGDYLRVWIKHSGTHYLIHLPKGKM